MARKAHGTAESIDNSYTAEPRPAGLNQTAVYELSIDSIAVLEQPSPGRVAEQVLGRRIIALVETTELNAVNFPQL